MTDMITNMGIAVLALVRTVWPGVAAILIIGLVVNIVRLVWGKR